MGYFVFPQRWIGPAIAAAAVSFGPIKGADDIHIHYLDLAPGYLAATRPPDDIGIDKRPRSAWTKAKAQCVIVHEYGHLSGYRDKSNKADPDHSANPRSIMYYRFKLSVCQRYRARHGLR